MDAHGAADAAARTGRLPSRETVWIDTLASQCVLLALAWVTGRGFGHRPFASPTLDASRWAPA